MTNQLTLDVVRQAVAGSAAAFRRVVELQPAGGPGAKVFPPTYEGGKYATEKRRINGETVDCVLLDSVQSQANRMELALQEAVDEKPPRISLPVITVDFTNTVAPWAGRITSLQAPHRIADAILRDSEWRDGEGRLVPFRKSPVGVALDLASLHNATILFEQCPTALVFGMWDSTALHRKADIGVKIARAIVSEIIGIGAVPGQRGSSRIDPLQISGAKIYDGGADGWTLDEVLDEKGKPKYIKKGGEGKPSEINHGNVKPALVYWKENGNVQKDKDGNPIPIGGFTLDKAQQITVLSLPALRRLKFKVNDGYSAEINNAARTVLTSLALCAATLSSENNGYDLRSNCALHPTAALQWEMLGLPGEPPQPFALNGAQSIEIFQRAMQEAKSLGLPWNDEGLTLIPEKKLADLALKSRTLPDEVAADEGTKRQGKKASRKQGDEAEAEEA